MSAAGRAVALQRERNAAEHIPYAAHVAERVVATVAGDYLQVFRLGGASFESADDDQLNNWHERLNVLWRNLASPHVALWTHLIRRPERPALSAASGQGFAQILGARYPPSSQDKGGTSNCPTVCEKLSNLVIKH